MIDRWFRDYSFPVDIVLEACDRTMRTIHQPSFEYADKILKDWKDKGVRAVPGWMKSRNPGERGKSRRRERSSPRGIMTVTSS